MKKLITLSVLSLGIIFLAGCDQEQINQKQPTVSQTQAPLSQETQKSVTFKEAGIESEFTLPTGLTYEKVVNHVSPDGLLPNGAGYDKKTIQGLDQFSFYDQNHKQVGGISLFAKNMDKNIETTFDDCWRAWNIGSSEMDSGNQNGPINKTPSVFGLDHYIYVTNDGLTSVAAESCGSGGHMAYIYWVPGVMITDHSSLGKFFGKKPVRVLGIHDIDMNDDDFIQLVHNIAKSVTIKNQK